MVLGDNQGLHRCTANLNLVAGDEGVGKRHAGEDRFVGEPARRRTSTSPARQRPVDVTEGTMADWAGAGAFSFGLRRTPGRVRLGRLWAGRGAEWSCRRSRVSPAGCPARWWLPAVSPVRSTARPPQ